MIPLFKPYMPQLGDKLNEILHSGNLGYGSFGTKFESLISEYIGHENVLTVSTYNQALLIVLSTLNLKPGDEIIASPVSCLASNQPFAVKGMKIIWADVEPDTGSLCVESLRKKISTKTKAIFHNHYCGYLGHIEEVNALGREYGIPVIDDCIEAFGSELNGKKAGNLGTDISVFSFQTVRLPNTIDGGAIVFEDLELFEKAKRIRDYGINRVEFRDELNEINIECDIKLEGYGALMNEVNSFIGVNQMKDLSLLLSQQQKNSNYWFDVLSQNFNEKPLKINSGVKPNFWVFGVLSHNKIKSLKKFREIGFYASGVHINNNIYSVFGNKENLPGVNDFMQKYLALPCGWWFRPEE